MTTADNGDHGGNENSSSKSKVASLIEEYDLHGLGDELVEFWTMDSDERKSLRELAIYFNKELLTKVLHQTTMETLDGEPSNYYRLLTDDSVSSGTRVQTENRLEQNGIDVDKLKADFVSRQAIHTYVSKERDAKYEKTANSDDERIENRLETIQRLKNRLVAVSNRILEELNNSNVISTGTTRVTVLIRVHCQDCEGQYPISELLTGGGCDCND